LNGIKEVFGIGVENVNSLTVPTHKTQRGDPASCMRQQAG